MNITDDYTIAFHSVLIGTKEEIEHVKIDLGVTDKIISGYNGISLCANIDEIMYINNTFNIDLNNENCDWIYIMELPYNTADFGLPGNIHVR